MILYLLETMGSEQVIEKIIADAEADAEKTRSETRRKTSAEREDLRRRLDQYAAGTAELAAKAARRVISGTLSRARMEQALATQSLKLQILEEVFAEAARRIRGLEPQRYKEFISSLLAAEIETGEESVIIDKKESLIDQKLLDKAVAASERAGKKLKLSDERRDIGAGFILERERIKKDVSLAALMFQARRSLEVELVGLLFPHEARDA